MAQVLPLVFHPDQQLRQKSRPVDPQALGRPEFKQLILDLEKTMQANKGVGLAAVQVGKLIRLTVINTDDGLLPLINPVIARKSWRKELGEEGCLSIPGVFGLVKRSLTISVRARDLEGNKIHFKAKGFFARVIQHEVDHLNGVLFIDRAKQLTEGQPAYRQLA